MVLQVKLDKTLIKTSKRNVRGTKMKISPAEKLYSQQLLFTTKSITLAQLRV